MWKKCPNAIAYRVRLLILILLNRSLVSCIVKLAVFSELASSFSFYCAPRCFRNLKINSYNRKQPSREKTIQLIKRPEENRAKL
jgi:hypothetical protein